MFLSKALKPCFFVAKKWEVLVWLVLFVFLALPFLAKAGEFPIGYPFSSWGEIRTSSNDDIEEKVVLDSYFEQGIDWWQVHGWTFNSFLGLRIVQSSDSDCYWNNKVDPIIGLKVKHPFKVFKESWGEISFGARGEYYNYNSSSPKGDDFQLCLLASGLLAGTGKMFLA